MQVMLLSLLLLLTHQIAEVAARQVVRQIAEVEIHLEILLIIRIQTQTQAQRFHMRMLLLAQAL